MSKDTNYHPFNIRKWLNLLIALVLIGSVTACVEPQPDITIPQTPPHIAKLTKQPRVVLVLGVGGVRGYAHLGVLQALEEAHIPVDVIVGSSAGSIVAALYADNDSYKQTYHIMMSAGFWDYADIANFTEPGGIIKGYHLENFLLEHMHARTFNQLDKKIVVATTDAKTGQTYTIESGPIAPAVLASAAVPGGVKPVHLYGHWLIDGGVSNPVPVDIAEKLHPKLIIAVNLSKTSSNKLPTTAYGFYGLAYDIMWQRLTAHSLKGANVVINPDVGDVNIFDITKKHEMYLAGLEAARKKIPEIKKLLAEKGVQP